MIKSRLDTVRKQNYRLKNQSAQAYSEKAEVEAAFIEGLEEAKRDVAKKQSVRMAERANASSGQQALIKKMQHISECIARPEQILIEQTVQNKVALMEIFDALFGHGGYSGVAF